MELTDSHWQLCQHQTKEKIQFTKWPLTQNDKITGSRAEARKYGECCGAGDLPAKRVARDNGDHLQSNTRAIHIKKGKSFLAQYYPICPIMHINMPQEWYLWFIYEKLETRLASPSVLQKAGDFFCKRFFQLFQCFNGQLVTSIANHLIFSHSCLKMENPIQRFEESYTKHLSQQKTDIRDEWIL